MLLGLLSFRPTRRSRIARRFGRQRDWVGNWFRAGCIASLVLASIQFADVGSTVAQSLDLETYTASPQSSTQVKPVGAKSLIAPVLDKWVGVKVDFDTENEYWVFGELPFGLGPLRLLRKETSFLEVIVSGFVAGFLVELSNALLLHPLDTLKTRLQTGQSLVPPDPALLYRRLYDGFLPVLATVPALSVFWSVKDLVRKSLIGMVKATLPFELADVLASTLASACGEAAYVAVKTPGQVLKIGQQTALFEEDRVRQRYSDQDISYSGKTFRLNLSRLWEEPLPLM